METKVLLTKRKIESFAAQYEIADPVLKKIFLQNLRNAQSENNDVFISHSSRDKDFVENLLVFLRYAKGGINGYVDWIDSDLPKKISYLTAERLAERIHGARKFIFVATSNSLKSVWCSWELGYAERDKGVSGIAILIAKPNNGRWEDNEYLQQYPWIEYESLNRQFQVHYPNGEIETLYDWLTKTVDNNGKK